MPDDGLFPRVRRASILLLIVIASGLVPISARAVVPPVPPGVIIAIAPFEYTGASCQAELWVAKWLAHYDFEPRRLESAPVDAGEFLRTNTEVTFLITGSVVTSADTLATADIYDRDHVKPRSIEATGGDACETLATRVLGYLTRESSVGAVVEARRQAAEKKLSSHPDDFQSLVIMGLACRFDGDWEGASQYFERAAAQQPNDPQVQLNLALCAKAGGDAAKSLQHLERAQALDRDDEAIGVALGNYYLTAGDFERAIGYYERWLGSPMNAALVRWNLAVLHTQKGDPEKARDFLREIPPSSVFFEDARAWAARLDEEIAARAAEAAYRTAPKGSAWDRLGLPEGFGVTLLVAALALVVAAFLPITKLGSLDIPELDPRLRHRLKFVSPLILISCCLLFVPFLRKAPNVTLVRPVFEAESAEGGGQSQPAAKH